MKRRSDVPRPPSVAVRRHPPERLVRAVARGEVVSAGFCCSCCCCLHSLGSLIGAATGSFRPADLPVTRGKAAPPVGLGDDELDGPADAAPAKQGTKTAAAKVFWRATAALIFLVFVVPPLIWYKDFPYFGINVMIFLLPAVLLGGSVVSALAIAGNRSLRGEAREWKRLGWITLGIVAGTLIGAILMLPLLFL